MCKKLEIKKGDVYGHLTIIKEVEPRIYPSGRKHRMVLVQCSCGNSEPFEVRLNSLRTGRTTSCGCIQREKLKENNKKKHKTNKYDLSGECGIGYTSKNEPFYFDKEDFEKIKDYCWIIDKSGYVAARVSNTKKQIKFHRLVMNASEGMEIDHRFHAKNDNRKENLREVTRSQNQMNRKITKNNKSGVVGVSWHKARNKWQAMITINGKQIHLGLFENLEDAINTRKDAEEKYFGEYAYKEII